MVTRSKKIKAGVFFLSGIAILLGFLLLLGFLQGGPAGVRYNSLFKGVRSLQEGTPVKFNGVRVGEVTSIKIARSDPGKVRVDYLVEQPHARHITDNTVAQLVYLSPISGQQCVSLAPSGPSDGKKSERLPAGASIPTRPSEVAATVEAIQKSLNNMNSLLSENRKYVDNLLKNTGEVMRSFRVLVGEPPRDGKKPVGLIELTDRLAKMIPRLEAISRRTEQTMAKAETSFESIQQVSSRLTAMMDENREDITTAVQNLSKTSTALREAVEKNQPRIGSAAADLQEASRTLNELVADIRGSWSSGRMKQDARNVSETLSELRKVTERTNRLARSLQETSSSLQGMVSENRETVRTSLRDVQRAADNLKELTATLKSRPSSVLFGGGEEKRELE
ncbi:MAG: MlaD family protein [Planctomycetota bacterium]